MSNGRLPCVGHGAVESPHMRPNVISTRPHHDLSSELEKSRPAPTSLTHHCRWGSIRRISRRSSHLMYVSLKSVTDHMRGCKRAMLLTKHTSAAIKTFSSQVKSCLRLCAISEGEHRTRSPGPISLSPLIVTLEIKAVLIDRAVIPFAGVEAQEKFVPVSQGF